MGIPLHSDPAPGKAKRIVASHLRCASTANWNVPSAPFLFSSSKTPFASDRDKTSPTFHSSRDTTTKLIRDWSRKSWHPNFSSLKQYMPSIDWNEFLTGFNQELLASDKIRNRLPAGILESGWLGFPGATEAEILETEARIGAKLPPSYRTFLQTTNGWGHTGVFIDRLWPSKDIAWFKERNQQWIDAYTDPAAGSQPLSDAEYLIYGDEQDTCLFREEYLKTALEISDTGDACIILLNPKIVTPEGEWEAWFFANWYPGAARYRSFRELMEEERLRFQRLEEKENAPRVEKARPGFLSRIQSLFGAKKSRQSRRH